ncbi:MAG: hypothetical protein IGS48_18950 [Oscillatoriales cyanobacterium C42_A2020_001]|nr:hypothetical protein [Leptolyngbyaceae cyanobacterium C42_A2020_001]
MNQVNHAIALREMLIQYAVDTKDHTVSDSFIKLLRTRSAVLLNNTGVK